MKHVRELLDQARQVIDGEQDCSQSEYRAMDLLHLAVAELVRKVESVEGLAERAERTAEAVRDGVELGSNWGGTDA